MHNAFQTGLLQSSFIIVMVYLRLLKTMKATLEIMEVLLEEMSYSTHHMWTPVSQEVQDVVHVRVFHVEEHFLTEQVNLLS